MSLQNKEKDKVKQFVEEKLYLDESVTLSKMATYVGINTVYLNNHLRAAYGKTYIRLINDLRLSDFVETIKTDKKMLEKYTMSAVVKQFGFTSYSTFLYSFRRKYKSSPKEYLKEYM